MSPPFIGGGIDFSKTEFSPATSIERERCHASDREGKGGLTRRVFLQTRSSNFLANKVYFMHHLFKKNVKFCNETALQLLQKCINVEYIKYTLYNKTRIS